MDLDVFVIGGVGIDTIVRVPGLPLAVALHPSGTRRSINLVSPDSSYLQVRGEEPVHIPAVDIPGRPVVDTNGAGDAYVAAFLTTDATITLDPAKSWLTLPLTGATSSLTSPDSPQARVPATRLAQPEPEKDPVKLMEQFVEASR